MNVNDSAHLDTILRHINHVRANCELLGKRLIEREEESLGVSLIANGYAHDASKFTGIEWLYLREDIKESNLDKFKCALLHHSSTNKHHPEAWVGGISQMDRLHTCEMICDWFARSSEFGSDLREWIKNDATKRFDFTVQSKRYKEIKDMVDILLDPKFKK